MKAVSLDDVPVPALLVGGERIIEANRQALSLFGLASLRDLQARALDELVREQDRWRALVDRRLDKAELTLCTQDGHEIAVRVTAADSQHGGVCLAFTDITQEASTRRWLNAVMAGSIQGVLVHKDMKPLYVNDTYAHIYGYQSAVDIMQMSSILELTTPEDRPTVQAHYEARMRGEPAPTHYTHRARRRDGQEIILDNIVQVIDWGGERAVQVTNVDVTEYAQMESDTQDDRIIKTAQLALGIARRFWDHYLQLRRIVGEAQIGTYANGLTEQAEQLDAMSRTLDTMRGDLERLMVTGRRGVPSMKSVELTDLVHEVVGRRLELGDVIALQEQRVRYRVDFADRNLWVNADPLQIKQALQALLDNAVEAMPEGGVVTIRVRRTSRRGQGERPASWVEIQVRDAGTGMDEAAHQAAFDPFFTTKAGHAGLGLSLVYSTVSAHGGEVAFDALPTGGTRFVLRLPALSADA